MEKQNSAIMQMFYGRRGNADNIGCTPEYTELLTAVSDAYDCLCKKLEPDTELWELFLKYKDALEEMHVCEVGDHYAEGFKFGLLIGVEAGQSNG